jgi:hypothetical protein
VEPPCRGGGSGEVGGVEVDVTWLAIENTQAHASEGLEATPSVEDV